MTVRPTQTRSTRLIRRGLAVTALVSGLILSGCSSQGSSTTPSPSGGETNDASSAAGASSVARANAAGPTGSTAVATASVPAPGGGSVKETVPAVAVSTPAPSPITATVAPVKDVRVSITTKATKLAAKVPGDISGDGVIVTVTIRNGSANQLPIGQTVVNLFDASGAPAVSFAGEPTKPFVGELAAGKSASATYAFGLEASQRRSVRVEVRGNPAMGIAVYRGAVKG